MILRALIYSGGILKEKLRPYLALPDKRGASKLRLQYTTGQLILIQLYGPMSAQRMPAPRVILRGIQVWRLATGSGSPG